MIGNAVTALQYFVRGKEIYIPLPLTLNILYVILTL